MKVLLTLIVTLLVLSCEAGGTMNKIDDLSLKVISSVNMADEEQAIEELWEYVADNRIYIEMFSIDENANKVDVNDISDVSLIKRIHVVFSRGEDTKVLEWSPINSNNAFILFREK